MEGANENIARLPNENVSRVFAIERIEPTEVLVDETRHSASVLWNERIINQLLAERPSSKLRNQKIN